MFTDHIKQLISKEINVAEHKYINISLPMHLYINLLWPLKLKPIYNKGGGDHFFMKCALDGYTASPNNELQYP